MSIVIDALKQMRCSMSAHTAFEDDEDLLFQKGINQIETTCKRCGTPLLLIRDKDEEEYYFITEKPVQNK